MHFMTCQDCSHNLRLLHFLYFTKYLPDSFRHKKHKIVLLRVMQCSKLEYFNSAFDNHVNFTLRIVCDNVHPQFI